MNSTQTSMILEHLKAGKDITPAEALHGFGCYRLAARIQDLRDSGHIIHTEMDKAPNGKRFARYRLIPGDCLQPDLPFGG